MYEITIQIPENIYHKILRVNDKHTYNMFIVISSRYNENTNSGDCYLELQIDNYLRLIKNYYIDTWSYKYESNSGMVGLLIDKKYIVKAEKRIIQDSNTFDIEALERQKKLLENQSKNNILLLIARKRNS